MAHTPNPLDVTAELSHKLERFRDAATTVDLQLVTDIGKNRDALRALMPNITESADWDMVAMAATELSEVDRIIREAYAEAKRDAAKVEELLKLAELSEAEEDEKGIAEELGKIVWDGELGRADPLLILKQLAPEKHREFVDVMRRGIELYDRFTKTPHYTVIATTSKWDANAASVAEDTALRQGQLSA